MWSSDLVVQFRELAYDVIGNLRFIRWMLMLIRYLLTVNRFICYQGEIKKYTIKIRCP
jgi:hypothetical protein